MEVSDQIINVLDKICEKFGIAVDWTSANVLPYLQQLCGKCVKYEMVTSIVWIVFALIAMIPVILALKYIFKNKNIGVNAGEYFTDYVARVFLFIVCFIGIGICIAVVMTQVLDIIACVTYPEKIVVKEIMKYLN